MSKKMKRNSNLIQLCFYGIWSKEDKRMVFIGLNQEDAETEFDLEDYSDENYSIVRMETLYDISGLE